MGVEAKKGLADVLGKAAQWLQTADDRILEYALEVTDPDPNARPSDPYEVERKVQKFKSVVDLLPFSPSILSKKILGPLKKEITRGIDHLLGKDLEPILGNRSREINALLEKLGNRAFRFSDPKSYLQLKNLILAIERMAFRNPEIVNLQKIPSLEFWSFLVSPYLTEEDKSHIFRAEKKKGISLRAFTDYVNLKWLQFLKKYDGRIGVVDHPESKRMRLLNGYLEKRWPHPLHRLRAVYSFERRHQAPIISLLLQEMRPEELREILHQETEVLFDRYKQSIQSSLASVNPVERRRELLVQFALGSELSLRGFDSHALLFEFTRRDLEGFYQTLPRGILSDDFFVQLLFMRLENLKVSQSASRIDDYGQRERCLADIQALVENELAAASSGMSPSFGKSLFSGFALECLSVGKRETFFSGAELFDFAEEIKEKGWRFLFGQESLVNDRLCWKDVQEKGTVTVTLDGYPKSHDPMEDEWEIAKKIFYDGKSLYEMVLSVVDNVTLSPNFSLLENPIHDAAGTARYPIRNIQVSYRNHEGQLNAVYERLETIAHETYHALEHWRGLSGVRTGGENFAVLREYGAYGFAAYVLEKYLEWRWMNRTKKPLTREEVKKIIDHIVFRRLSAATLAKAIEDIYPPFRSDGNAFEIPLSGERDMMAQIGPLLNARPDLNLLKPTDIMQRSGRLLFDKGVTEMQEEAQKNGEKAMSELESRYLLATKPESEETVWEAHSELWSEGVWKGQQAWNKKEKERLLVIMPWLKFFL